MFRVGSVLVVAAAGGLAAARAGTSSSKSSKSSEYSLITLSLASMTTKPFSLKRLGVLHAVAL